MRLLLLNANTNPEMTMAMMVRAREIASPAVEIFGVTARFGASYVASRATYAIAGHAALEAYAKHAGENDAVLLACFGDPGLFALRELATVPVVGMAEAACMAAAEGGRRFAIVTGGKIWEPMLREFVEAIGLGAQLAGIATIAPTGAAIAADPEGSTTLLARASSSVAQDTAADVVILGGAALAALAPRVAAAVQVPVIDALAAAVKRAEALMREPVAAMALPPEPVGSAGLTPELAALLAHPHRAAG